VPMISTLASLLLFNFAAATGEQTSADSILRGLI
jgi:hypothetical protein